MDLAYTPLVDYDGLRGQMEGNFRDAKQYWGLEGLMTVTSTGVTSAVNRSLCIVNVAYHLRSDIQQRDPDDSVLDLKADCRGYEDVAETITLLPEKPEPVLFAKMLNPGLLATWAHQSLSHLRTLQGHAGAYFVCPRTASAQATTQFGRLDHCSGSLALLVTMAFHNDST